jgi:bifunctional DNA-binding transcriptional regulator/antitoxin component of YhaV-PrlF toxin-antitoxin module
MDTMTFPAKVMKPLRIGIPEAVGEAMELEAGDLVEVTVKIIKSASKSKSKETKTIQS